MVIDFSKYLHEIGDADAETGTVVCQPGAINEQVNKKTGQQIGMIFGPDPSTHSRCTIGGNIGNNSCGIHSVQAQLYGPGPRTSDNVEAMEVVTYDGARFWVGRGRGGELEEIIAAGGRKGEIYARLRDLRDRYADLIRERYQPVDQLPRRVSGYNLDELLPERGLQRRPCAGGHREHLRHDAAGQAQADPGAAATHAGGRRVRPDPRRGRARHGDHQQWKPIGLEALDHRLIENETGLGKHVSELEELPRRDRPHASWLMVQFGADTAGESESTAERFRDWLLDEKGYDPVRDQDPVLRPGGRP